MGGGPPGPGRSSQSGLDDEKPTVERLLTDSSGRSVTGVAVTLPDGSPHAFTADIVVLSAGAILSAALLLKSANDKHPHGLANSSDMVGRNYMRHNNLALIAFSRELNPTVFQKTLALNDFYGPGEHWQYPMGHIQMLGKSDDWQIKGGAPAWAGLRRPRTARSRSTRSTSGCPARTSPSPTAGSRSGVAARSGWRYSPATTPRASPASALPSRKC